MGGGIYNLNTSKLRSASTYASLDNNSNINDLKRSKLFSSGLKQSLDPRFATRRESRDSTEHPNSVAIILGLDVTGSMGSIPAYMLKEGLNHSIELFFNTGIKDPQVSIIAIGDIYSDNVPLQVSQFESSDELIDKCLRDVYPEGNGGGNRGESYNLAWYHAAFHTSIDCYEKRKQKGLLITIGDEACHNELDMSLISKLYNLPESSKNISTSEILNLAKEKYVVKHICITGTSQGSSIYTQEYWKNLLGEDVSFLNNHEKIGETLKLIIENYSKLIGNNIISDVVKSSTKVVVDEDWA